MTPAGVIAEVRRLINDVRAPQRYSDSDLLGFANQTLKRIAAYRPDLFARIGDIPTTANTTVQSMPADCLRLIDVFSVKGGSVVQEVDRDTMDRAVPTWRSEAAGSPTNFMRHARNPSMFFLYPAPTSGVELLAEYAQTPPDYALNDTIAALSDAYFPSVVDGTVFLTQSVDDEHVISGRAELMFKSFIEGLGVTLKARIVTDNDDAGLKPKEVG